MKVLAVVAVTFTGLFLVARGDSVLALHNVTGIWDVVVTVTGPTTVIVDEEEIPNPFLGLEELAEAAAQAENESVTA